MYVTTTISQKKPMEPKACKSNSGESNLDTCWVPYVPLRNNRLHQPQKIPGTPAVPGCDFSIKQRLASRSQARIVEDFSVQFWAGSTLDPVTYIHRSGLAMAPDLSLAGLALSLSRSQSSFVSSTSPLQHRYNGLATISQYGFVARSRTLCFWPSSVPGSRGLRTQCHRRPNRQRLPRN